MYTGPYGAYVTALQVQVKQLDLQLKCDSDKHEVRVQFERLIVAIRSPCPFKLYWMIVFHWHTGASAGVGEAGGTADGTAEEEHGNCRQQSSACRTIVNLKHGTTTVCVCACAW